MNGKYVDSHIKFTEITNIMQLYLDSNSKQVESYELSSQVWNTHVHTFELAKYKNLIYLLCFKMLFSPYYSVNYQEFYNQQET